jgi:hypothetical protein
MNILSLKDEALHGSRFPEKLLWDGWDGRIQKMCKLNAADGLKITSVLLCSFVKVVCLVNTMASLFVLMDEIVQQKYASWCTQMYLTQ